MADLQVAASSQAPGSLNLPSYSGSAPFMLDPSAAAAAPLSSNIGASTSVATIPPVGNSSASPQQATLPMNDTGLRPFRSKKVRPCDGCRRRKNRCALPVVGEPCVECRQTGRPCTFDLPPPRRNQKSSTKESTEDPPSLDILSGPNSRASDVDESARREHSSLFDHTATKRSRPAESTANGARPLPPAEAAPPHVQPASLDQDLPPGMEMSAVTATLTDDLLTHRTAAPSRQISKDANHAQFVLFRKIPPHRPVFQDEHEKLLRTIEGFISATSPELSTTAMYEHYLEFLHPSMPVLPLDPKPALSSLPPGLRAAILVEAFAYLSSDPRQSAYVWTLFKSSLVADRLLYTSRLSSLATAVLELSSAIDPRGDYLLLAKTIAQAQALGLHLDCRAWAIPEREKSLRTRLWWCLRIYDAWASFLNSHPSHIQKNNQNVELPALPSDVSPVGPAIANVAFVLQCRLATIVSRLQHEVCTLESFGSPDRVLSCDAVERDLDALCGSVSAFTASRIRPVGMDCFLFNLFAFRCMVRRISIEIRIGLGNAFAPDGKTIHLFADFVAFCASLTDQSLGTEQPWYCYTAHILSSVLSSLIRVSLAALGGRTHAHSALDPSITGGSHIRAAHIPLSVQLLNDLSLFLGAARREYSWTRAESAIERARSVAQRLSAIAQADAATENYATVVQALGMVDAEPSPGESNGTGSSLAALDLLASLIHHDQPAASAGTAATTSEQTIAWPPPPPDQSSTSQAPLNEVSPLFGNDTLDLPDLEDWLNVLDGCEQWGGGGDSADSWPTLPGW